MKQVQNLRSERIAVYPPGAIPINRLLVGAYAPRLAEAFSFSELAPGEGRVELKGGIFKDSGVVVLALAFDARRIVLGVEGSAADADAVMAKVDEILLGDATAPEPVTVSAATSCTARLDFDWSELYSPKLMDFIGGKVLPAAGEQIGAEPWVSGSIAQFQIKFDASRELDENAVTLSPKLFSVGPEEQRPLSERRYSTSSPTRSEEHFKLLKGLESALGNRGASP